MAMQEKEFNGNVGKFRKSDFVDAAEDLAGTSRQSSIEVTIEKPVVCDGVISKNGKKEGGVFAVVLQGFSRRLRINATKRKILVAATGSPKAIDFAGIKIRLYQTVDSDMMTGGKTYVPAVAIDVQVRGTDQWLRYYDFQQKKGQFHVMAAGLVESGKA